MRDVVVDEGPYIRAMVAEQTLAPDDLRWANVLRAVQARHRWVLTNEINDRYWDHHAEIPYKGVIASGIVESLTGAMASQTASVWLQEWTVVVGAYHAKDQHVVGAAAAVKDSVLITIDGRLFGALTAAGIPLASGFTVALLDEAEALLVDRA